jgi:hypothetical protein
MTLPAEEPARTRGLFHDLSANAVCYDGGVATPSYLAAAVQHSPHHTRVWNRLPRSEERHGYQNMENTK